MKKPQYLLLMLMLSMSLTACSSKEEAKDVPVPEEVTSEVSTEEMTTEEAITEEEPETDVVEVVPEENNGSKMNSLQILAEENFVLNSFMNEALHLQELKLKELYASLEYNSSHKAVVEAIDASGLRFVENATLKYLYDDTGALLDMEDRKGIVVFTNANTDLSQELDMIKPGIEAKKKRATENSGTVSGNEVEESTEDLKETPEKAEVKKTDKTEEEETTEDKNTVKADKKEETETETETEEASTENGTKTTLKDTESNPADTEKVEETNLLDEVVVNAKDCTFDSYIVFTFNDDNVLVGKFKYLTRNEQKSENLNYGILEGELKNDDYGISLVLDKDADVTTIYEKTDALRTKIEQNEKDMVSNKNDLNKEFDNFYTSLSTDTTFEEFAKLLDDSGFGVERMNASNLKTINDRFLREYKNGFYLYLTKIDDQTTPELRYSNYYMTVVFDENDKLYYKFVNSDDLEEEACEDIKTIDDYTLKEINQNIKDINDEITSINGEREFFTKYLDENINLLNSNVTFDMNYDEVVSEIKSSQLDCTTNYNNLLITEIKDSEGNDISIYDEEGNAIYDSCIEIIGGTKNLYYFFNGPDLVGVYRSDYFDIKDVTISAYKSLSTVQKGLAELDENVLAKEQELKTFTNMIDKKMDDFKNNIGYSTNHTEGQLYQKARILEALQLSGFTYEEGVNKSDSLYYIGVFKYFDDTSYSLKIYFNSNLEVELVQ